MILSVILAAGMISPVSVCAAEISEQETVPAQSEAADETETDDQEADTSEADDLEASDRETDEPETVEAEAVEPEEEDTAAVSAADSETDPEADPAAEEVSTDAETKPEELFTDEIVIIEGAEEVVLPNNTGVPSSDELFDEFVERSFEGQPLAKAAKKLRSAVSVLQGYDRAVYNYIAGFLPQIAAGDRASTVFEITAEIMGAEKTSWTAEELGVDAVIAKDENGKAYIPKDAQDAALAEVAINLSRILDVLLAEHPYELYWYDKTSGAGTKMTGFGLRSAFDHSLGTYVVSTTGSMYLRFSVAEEYSAGEFLVDTSIGKSVQGAVDRANTIVAKYSGASDEEKLRGYKNDICDLVSYNNAVSSASGYGNPWQMIWVFDGNPDTNVVCEGYAKAFKYLCDHTEFEGDIECILAGGTIVRNSGSEPHMWNILKMEDKKNYLVDVTNCDYRTMGYPDKLFLAGTDQTRTDGSGNSGYYFSNTGLTYYYDADTRDLFGEADLEICPHNYGRHEWGTELILDEEATCTEDGFKSFHCTICDAINQNEIEVLPATGHNYSEWDVTKKETCEEDGSRKRVCAKCGDVSTEIIPASGHDFTDWTEIRKATGTETGIREKTCANCGERITEEIPVLSGKWIRNSTGWWYQWSDHSYPVSMFVNIGGKTYYFNASGYMVTGWQKIDGVWYYMSGGGAMQTGWQKIGGAWYYMNSSGAMQTGWQTINGVKYYMNSGGAMQTGWQKIDGVWYYMSGGGAMQTGWQKIGGTWYYMNSSGAMQTGWQTINGVKYYMNGGGAMQTGWQKIDGVWYYMSGGGAMQTGWLYLGGKWYYMNSDGAMQTGWQTINGKPYYFDGSGAMR